jgi:hypothetical protein
MTEELEAPVEATIEGLAELARTQLRLALAGTEPEVSGVLRDVVLNGRVDGGTYWRASEHVGCPLGWIAFAAGEGLPGAAAYARPTGSTYALEDWAAPIRRDDVPDHTQHEDSGEFRAALLVSWIDEFEAERVVA